MEECEEQLAPTSEDTAIASPIIANPASIFRTFLTFPNVINRRERVSATEAGSGPWLEVGI
jgi:hypothetical protein